MSAARRIPAALLLTALALLAAGCGLLAAPSHPAARRRPASPGSTATAARTATSGPAASPRPGAAAIAATRRTHELPTPAPRLRVDGGWRSAAGAAREFASAYVNWTAPTVAARLRALAAASVGQARAELVIEAREVAGDRELQAGGVTNRGTVEAVARLPGAALRYAVVTRERTGALRSTAYRGLAPAWHVSIATVTRVRGGLWVLSGWQPEN